jgi:hypothetical protein
VLAAGGIGGAGQAEDFLPVQNFIDLVTANPNSVSNIYSFTPGKNC